MTNPTVTAKEALEAARNFLMQFVEGEPQGLLIHPDVDATAFTHAWDDTSSKVRAALSALDAGPVGVKVKPLEWSECRALGRQRKLVADDAFGHEFARLDLGDRSPEEIAAFKAAKQADYERHILSALSEPTWQPMETAPKDGTKIDVLRDGVRIIDVYWRDKGIAGWCFKHGYPSMTTVLRGDPQFWMPIPTAPEPRT